MSDAAGPALGLYNDSNRAFLQSFMARGTLTSEEGKSLLAALFTVQEGRNVLEEEVTQADFESYISAAADAVNPFDYEIRSTQDQHNKKRIYALVNSVSDPFTQMATIRTTDEMLYIKRLVDAIFETYNTKARETMAIRSLEALESKIRKGTSRRSDGAASTQSGDKGLTNDQAEKLLSDLQKEKWLERSKEGYYTLSPRALMELRSWLVDAYNDQDEPDEWQRIKFCEACKEIVTIGQRCAERDCSIRLHNICQETYFRGKQSKTCPKCQTAWDGKHYVGEKVITTTDAYLKGRRRSGISKKRAAQPEPEEEEEPEGPRPSRRKTQPSKKSRSARIPEPEEEEEEEEEAAKEDEEDEEEARPRGGRRNGKQAMPGESDDE